jgi:hypothetical protein
VKRKGRLTKPLSLTYSLALLGCSGGNETDDGVDRSASFLEVAQDQPDYVCKEVDKLVERDADYLTRLCTVTALASVPTEAETCVEDRATCMDDPPQQCDLRGVDELPCPDATVGMFLDCMRGTIRRTKEIYADVTCDDTPAQAASLVSEASLELNVEPPPECEQFKRNCPAFFGALSSGDMSASPRDAYKIRRR